MSQEIEKKEVKRAHSLHISADNVITVSGVTDVPTFGEKTIVATLDSRVLTVSGDGLKIEGLNLESGVLSAKGKVTALRYSSTHEPQTMLRRFFK